jgi:hypothetical protein
MFIRSTSANSSSTADTAATGVPTLALLGSASRARPDRLGAVHTLW